MSNTYTLHNLYSFLDYVALLDLSARDYRVFLHILKEINSNDYVIISQKRICIDLYMQKSEVSKAIKNLLDKEIIERDLSKEDNRSKYIRIKNYTKTEINKLISNHIDKN